VPNTIEKSEKRKPLQSNDLTTKTQTLKQVKNLQIDIYVDAANRLLSDKFPSFQGLSTLTLEQKMQFQVYDCFAAAAGLSYIQIIHCPTLDHWVTLEVSFDEGFLIAC